MFKIAKIGGSYAATPTMLASFNIANGDGAFPAATLFADAAGNLFGTTEQGGANFDGTVFEVTGSGFEAPPAPPAPPPAVPAGTSGDMIMRDGSNGDYEIYDVGNNAILAAGPLGQVGLEWQVAGVDGFFGTDTSDMILRNSYTGQFEIYDVSNNDLVGASAMGTGRFGVGRSRLR